LLTTVHIVRTWWPLAASWILMALEPPAITAVIARLPQPEINLAAYGGLVYPLALIIESPIIMLLAASTALSADLASYRKIWRLMMVAGAALTGVHILIVFTPLYYVVARGLMGAPDVVLEPARLGLMLLTPWTWSIAYRRFNQGLLIRNGHSRAVGFGTVMRLLADSVVLVAGYLIGSVPGAAVAGATLSAGVVSEAIYAGWVVRPVVSDELSLAPDVSPPLTLRGFLTFYWPLVMTSLLSLLAQPLGSAALSRMPQPLISLAVWPVVTGLVFMFRSLGVAYNEVVVALLSLPDSAARLRRFAGQLAGLTTAAIMLIAATPLAAFWFQGVTGLSPELVALARTGLWLTVPLPALTVLQSWYQGTLLYSRRTRGISEAVAVYLLVTALVLSVGVSRGQITGLYVGLAALTISTAAQTAWLWLRARPALQLLRHRDSLEPESPRSYA
jgi:hypothetical protein